VFLTLALLHHTLTSSSDEEEEPTSKEGSAPDGNNGSNGNGHNSNGSKDGGNGTSRWGQVEALVVYTSPAVGIRFRVYWWGPAVGRAVTATHRVSTSPAPAAGVTTARQAQ
jgi:hypothetical protein